VYVHTTVPISPSDENERPTMRLACSQEDPEILKEIQKKEVYVFPRTQKSSYQKPSPIPNTKVLPVFNEQFFNCILLALYGITNPSFDTNKLADLLHDELKNNTRIYLDICDKQIYTKVVEMSTKIMYFDEEYLHVYALAFANLLRRPIFIYGTPREYDVGIFVPTRFHPNYCYGNPIVILKSEDGPVGAICPMEGEKPSLPPLKTWKDLKTLDGVTPEMYRLSWRFGSNEIPTGADTTTTLMTNEDNADTSSAMKDGGGVKRSRELSDDCEAPENRKFFQLYSQTERDHIGPTYIDQRSTLNSSCVPKC